MKANKKFSKQILSIALCLAMILSYVPMSVFAADEHSHPVCGASHTDIGDHTGDCSNIAWTKWESTTEMPTEAGAYYLANDVVLSATWEIPDGIEISLCLNGHSVSGNNAVRVITVGKTAKLNVCDCSAEQSGKITNGYKSDASGGGVWVYTNSIFNFFGGNITSNRTAYQGGGVYIFKGTFNMYGGSISDNASASMGGGVYNNAGVINVYDGSISNNTTSKMGGGVLNSGTFVMTNGTISSNTVNAVGTYCDGGGVFVNYGSFRMSGGEIKNNTATKGTGIYVTYLGKIQVFDSPIITDNIFLNSTTNGTAYITVIGTLNDGASISSTNRTVGEVFSNGTSTYSITENDASKFTAASGQVVLDKWNNRLVLCNDTHPTYENGACKTCGMECVHTLAYEKTSNDVITETCTANSNCGHKATATLTMDSNVSTSYSGTEIEAVKIDYSDEWYGEKTTEISYTNNINASTDGNPATASITVEGQKLTKTFTIIAANIVDATVTLTPESGDYTGSAYAPEISVSYNGASLVEGTDYEVSWNKTGYETPDTYTARIVGINNFTGYVDKTFTINAANLSDVKVEAEELTYNGSSQTPTVNASAIAVNGQQITFTYSMDENGEYGDLPTFTEAGDYTVYYKASAPYHNDAPVGSFTVKVNEKEIDISWGETTDLAYTGSSLVPTATATNLEGNDICTLATEVVEEAEGAGIIPGTWTAKVTALSNKNYKLPESNENVSVQFQIINASQNDAPDVSGVNETIDGKADGKITGVDSTMEYRKEGEDTYTAISGTELTNLEDGTYYVRYVAKTYYNASPDKMVVISAGRKLTVTVPQNQVGYTMTTTTPEVDWYGSIHVEFKLEEGYSMTSDFEIYNNGTEAMWRNFNQTTGVLELNFVGNDFNFTVEGVADTTAPEAEMTVGTNSWNKFWNTITFGLFFKETQTVTVIASDNGSGMRTEGTFYYLADKELTKEEAEAITDWTAFSGSFNINPNNNYVVYVKAIDNAGNAVIINSDGIVLDDISPAITGVEDGKTYYGETKVTVADTNIDKIYLDDEEATVVNGVITITPDNAAHTVKVTDKAGNESSVTFSVYKIYTVTFLVDGNTYATQQVNHGSDAEMPSIPTKTGYDQTAPVWDKDGKNITADTDIKAVYTVNNYTVTVPSTQVGYTLTVDKTDITHGEAVKVTFTLAEGYSEANGFAVKVNGDAVTLVNGEYTIESATGNIAVTVEGVADITAPNAEITLGTNSWNTFWNNVTFGLFFKNTQSVIITANDKGSGLDAVYYYLADKELTEDEVKAIIEWKAYNGAFSINPDNEYVIYAKAVDKDGNAVYLNSAGIVLDSIVPVISGVEDGATYYTTQKLTVTDDNLDIITVNDEDRTAELLQAGNVVLAGDVDTTYTVVVTDKAGNSTTVIVTMKTIASVETPIGDITDQNVTSDDKDEIQDVIDKVEELLKDDDLTDEEKKNLEDIRDNAQELIDVIEKTAEDIKDVTDKADTYDEKNVNSSDKDDLDKLKEDIQDLLDGENLTEEERKALEDTKKDAEDLLDRIEDAKNAIDNEGTEKVKDITAGNVKMDDKEDLKKAKDDLEKALENYPDNYTEDEKKAIEDDIKRIEEALDIIKDVEAVKDKINSLPDNIDKDDTGDVNDAKKAYDGLSDYEKSLIDSNTKNKLDAAIKAIEEANKAIVDTNKSPQTENAPNTGDNTNFMAWFILLFGSMAAFVGLVLGKKKKEEE